MPITSESFNYISKIVYENSAIVLSKGKEYLVESRLSPVVAQNNFSSIDEYVDRLKSTPFSDLHKELIEAMTTNETSFFRDIHPFEAIKKSILPELQARRSAANKIYVWCGACSSGQEPYSLAILIREHFPVLGSSSVSITASDISEKMLSKARSGSYGPLEINRGMPAPLMVKYFEKQGINWQVKQEIRDMIDFRKINLMEDWPPMPKMDIVMLRNVLIYFDQDTKRVILGKIRKILKPDGYLFLGSAETTFNLDDAFERVMFGSAVTYRLKSRGE